MIGFGVFFLGSEAHGSSIIHYLDVQIQFADVKLHFRWLEICLHCLWPSFLNSSSELTLLSVAALGSVEGLAVNLRQHFQPGFS